MKKNFLFLLMFVFLSFNSFAEELKKVNSFASFGEPIYKDFKHFNYVNPEAKKGGKITLGAYGTFDNLNPYILKGQVPSGLSMTTDSLMESSSDELMAVYAKIAEYVEFPKDISYALFSINPLAKYNNGDSITASDFKFSFDMMNKYGAPFLQNFYKNIKSVEVLSNLKIKFNFVNKNKRQNIIIASSFTPMSEVFWKGRDFSKITLDVQPSSGAYKIKSIDAGRSIVYERNKNYWANDLNINIGKNNFDEIKYDYYKDEEVMFEAFKAGKIDFRIENKASRWVNGYDLPAVKKNKIIRAEINQNTPMGLQGIFFNTRKDKLQDVKVRRALEKLFNFEYIQKNLLNGKYRRSKNYFNNSDWGYKHKGDEYFLPTVNSEKGVTRANKRSAINLLREAGYIIKDQKLINEKTGEQFTIEFLLIAASMERVILPYVMDLRKVGIDANIRKVDTSQYVNRVNSFEFDAIVVNFSFFAPPGVELLSYYSSESANIKGSANYTGIRSEKIDSIIKEILVEQDLNRLKDKTKILDKELLEGYYGIPQWYNDKSFISYWNKFKIPKVTPKYGIGFLETWEIKDDLEHEVINDSKNYNYIYKMLGVIFLISLFLFIKKDLKKNK
ncbi:MAG: extracellular solute-binding protein [Alphaproteobacteria bacterium]|jgi:microcin C transport system substrate-binding protein|nr:extracellular solute-binding protein [Alphaproteobacteria bacterium]